MSDWYDKRAPRQFITGDDIRQAASRNEREVKISQNSTVTDEARELAMRLAIRLDDGTAKRSVSLASSAPRASGPSALSAAQPTLPDDTNKLIVEAVTAVLDGLDLGDRKAALLPTIVRRVFAGLEANRS